MPSPRPPVAPIARSLLPLLAAWACLEIGAVAAAAAGSNAAASDSVAAESNRSGDTPVAQAGASLAATTEAPWNPPQPRGDSAPWEYAVRLPGRILSLPLVAVGYASEHALLLAEEHSVVPKVGVVFAVLPALGVGLQGAAIGDRAGLGAVLGVSPPRLPYLRAQLGGSFRGYSRFALALSGGPLALTYNNDWRPMERFYGLGLDTDNDRFASYAEKVESATFSIGIPVQKKGGPPARAHAETYVSTRSVVVTDGRESGTPDVSEVFPEVSSELGVPRENLVYGVSVAADRRNGGPHWSRGWRVLASAERFDDAQESLSLHDASTPAAQFTRYTAELETGFSFMRDPRTIRLFLRGVDQDVASGEEHFVVTDLAKLGGYGRLGGFTNGRFRELDMAMGRLSYIFPLAQHFELDFHGETGGVYHDLHTATIASLATSWGIALRPRSKAAPIGLFGVDFSRDGVNVHWALGGVE
jgi:hypothetical protein